MHFAYSGQAHLAYQIISAIHYDLSSISHPIEGFAILIGEKHNNVVSSHRKIKISHFTFDKALFGKKGEVLICQFVRNNSMIWLLASVIPMLPTMLFMASLSSCFSYFITRYSRRRI